MKNAFPNSEIVAPQLTGHVVDDLVTLKKLVFQYAKHGNQIHIVGTSLGGFYTLCLAADGISTNISKAPKFYVINPSFSPHETLLKYKDKEVPNYKSGPSILLIDSDFTELKIEKDFMVRNFKEDTDLKVFIGTEDEVLEFGEFFEFLENKILHCQIEYSEQDHRFANIDSVIKSLRLNGVS
jgi:predicted esterase YcpF (UPF0227 family)